MRMSYFVFDWKEGENFEHGLERLWELVRQFCEHGLEG